jgi:hypothetical protein
MGDVKRAARDLEADVKETWRKADGEESLGDKLANAGDRVRHGIENAGDELHEKVDQTGRDLEHGRGRMDEAARREGSDR